MTAASRSRADECAGLRALALRMDRPGLAGLIHARDQSDLGLVLLLTDCSAPSAEQRSAAAAEWRSRRPGVGPFGLPPGASERMRQAHRAAHGYAAR